MIFMKLELRRTLFLFVLSIETIVYLATIIESVLYEISFKEKNERETSSFFLRLVTHYCQKKQPRKWIFPTIGKC